MKIRLWKKKEKNKSPGSIKTGFLRIKFIMLVPKLHAMWLKIAKYWIRKRKLNKRIEILQSELVLFCCYQNKMPSFYSIELSYNKQKYKLSNLIFVSQINLNKKKIYFFANISNFVGFQKKEKNLKKVFRLHDLLRI